MAYRHKSAARFQAEVEDITRRYGARLLFMADNIMAMDYYDDFMSWARQRELNVDFFYEIKANVTRKQVKALREGGCTMVQPGIESFSTNVLNLMRKGVKAIQNVAFLKYARDYGVDPVYNILCGFPGESSDDYRHMTEQLAKLSHLKPPNAIMAIQYHRFSPYHRSPESFGIRLRPDPLYRYVYDLPEQELARIAYHFERVDDGASSATTYAPSLGKVTLPWFQSYREERCTLTWRAENGDILICDRRHNYPERDYRLGDHAVHVFRALDVPRTLDGAVREADRLAQGHTGEPETPSQLVALRPRLRVVTPAPLEPATPPWRAAPAEPELARSREHRIRFDRDAFVADAKACLDWLCNLGLLYFDDDRYLALPVTENAPNGRMAVWRRAPV